MADKQISITILSLYNCGYSKRSLSEVWHQGVTPTNIFCSLLSLSYVTNKNCSHSTKYHDYRTAGWLTNAPSQTCHMSYVRRMNKVQEKKLIVHKSIEIIVSKAHKFYKRVSWRIEAFQNLLIIYSRRYDMEWRIRGLSYLAIFPTSRNAAGNTSQACVSVSYMPTLRKRIITKLSGWFRNASRTHDEMSH